MLSKGTSAVSNTKWVCFALRRYGIGSWDKLCADTELRLSDKLAAAARERTKDAEEPPADKALPKGGNVEIKCCEDHFDCCSLC